MSALDEKKDFSEFYLSDELQRALKSVGYKSPTPVQASSIPLIMAGIDLIVQSQTGTGKTAAFAIPIIEMVEAQPGTIEVLVLAPTRELAKQVSEEFEKLGRFKDVEATAVYGGASYGPQIEAVKKAQVVCATPGRLLDLIERKDIDLSNLSYLILDEADEMLSMGFERDVREIIKHIPEDRQSLLFSATVTEDVSSLAKTILFYPEFISFSSDSVLNTNVTHSFVTVNGISRLRDLVRLLEYEEPDNAIIFANTKADTFAIYKTLKRHGYPAAVLNGDMAQSDREKTLAKMHEGKVKLLVATDVAARGIDITDLSHVFNYILPETPEVYVHRTGRTGRAGKSGEAISLVSPGEMTSYLQVKKHCDIQPVDRSLPTAQEIAEARKARAMERLQTKLNDAPLPAYGDHLALADTIMALDDKRQLTRMVAQLIAAATRPAPEPIVIEREVPVEAPEQREAHAEAKPEEPAAKKPEFKSDEQLEPKYPVEVEEQEDTSKPTKSPDREQSQQGEEQGEQRRRRGGRRGSQRRGSQRRDNQAQDTQDQPRQENNTPKQASRPNYEMQRMFVNMGKNIFEQANDFLVFAVHMSGMDDDDFGKVSLEHNHTLIEVRKDYLYDVIHALNNQKWEGRTITAKQARD